MSQDHYTDWSLSSTIVEDIISYDEKLTSST